MQEVIKLVETIKNKLDKILTFQSSLSKTHVQVLSEEWITSDQVMFILKIGLSSLKSLKRSRKLPYTKINGLSYFRTMDIEELLKKHYINHSSNDQHSTFNPSSHDER